jgi:hypothetical protein
MKNFKKYKISNKCKTIIFFILIILINKLQAQEFEFIAQHEGRCSAIGYFDNYIYFNSGGNINVLETGINNEFTLINSYYIDSYFCNDINIISNRMFLSISSGVLIYDLADPVNPELIGNASSVYSLIQYSIIADTILIALREDHAVLYNISDPSQPEYITNITYINNRNCTYTLHDNILYGFQQYGYSGPQHLQGYDISDPGNPYLSVELQLSPNYQAPWPDYMESYNNNLFVAFNDTLKIYDISDSDTIVYKTQFSVPNEICKLLIKENIIYISVLGSGIYIFDISNLFEPDLIGIYNQPLFIYNFDINSDHIYCGLDNRGFRIADKTDLQNIQDIYDYTHTDAVYSVHIRNNLAYLGMKASGLQVVDFSNILNPVKYGNIETLSNIDEIESIPGFLYCMEEIYDSIIHIVNISDSLNPQKVGEIQAPHNYIREFCIDQNRLFILDSLYYIEIYDLSIPESPVLLSTIQEFSTCLAVKDSLLVLCESSNLKLFLIENNYSITLQDEIILGEYSTHRPFQIEIEYPYIYVRSRAGIIVLFIDHNNNLSICDEIIWSGYTDDLAYDDTYIYLIGYFSGSQHIVIINKTNLYNLTINQIVYNSGEDLAFIDNNFCLAGSIRGYYFYGQDFVGIEEIPLRKDEFNINCYPNPCSKNTTIYFILPEGQKAKIDIYNLSGQKIVDFNITNKNKLILETNNFTPGIYFYKISTNEISYTKKLIVTK